MDNNDNVVETIEQTSSQQVSLEQPQQVVEVQEATVENGHPFTEFNGTPVAASSNLEAIPLPYIEASSTSEQNFVSEEKEPNLNEEEPSVSEGKSNEVIQYSSVLQSDENKSLELSNKEQEEGQGSYSGVQQVSHEKQTNVEFQDLDYWELEDEDSNVGNVEKEWLNENPQQISVDNTVETMNRQGPCSPNTEFGMVDGDGRQEGTEQVLRQEEQEVTGEDDWKDGKELLETNQQEAQPMTILPTAFSSDKAFPVTDSTALTTPRKDQENLIDLPALGSLSSSIDQESHSMHNYSKCSYPTGESLSDETRMFSLRKDKQSDVASLTNSTESGLNANERHGSLENSNEKEQDIQQYTHGGVEMERKQTNASNEKSSVQMDVVKEGHPFGSQHQDEASQAESKILSLEESKFSDTFESRARLHMLGDSQYKEKGWGHVKLQKLGSHTASKLTFSVEPATSIFESKIDTDTKFQRVRAKSVRISGSKEQGKDDFVLQLPDTQVADDLVEFLTIAIDEQTKAVSPSSSTERDLSRAQSLENDALAQKRAEMERVRQHIAELEKRKALVRQSLQRKGKPSSEKASPVTSLIPNSPPLLNLETSIASNNIGVPTSMLSFHNGEEDKAFLTTTNQVHEHKLDNEAAEQMSKPESKSTWSEREPEKDTGVEHEHKSMELVLPVSQQGNIHSVQEQGTEFPNSEQMSNQISSQEEFSQLVQQIHKLEEYVQEQFQSTRNSISSCLKREELDASWNKLMEMFTNETDSRMSLLLSEIDGVVKLLDRNREDSHSEAFTSCRPWSFSDFLTRLRTFRPITWPAKPECIDGVECARRGWRNVGFNLLECEGKYVYFDETATNYVEEVEAVRKKITGRGYRFMSPWIGNPCPETFRQVPWNTICRTIERAKELRDLELSVQLDKNCIDLLNVELEMFSKPRMEDIIQFFALDDERKRNSFFLGIFGWTMEPLMKQSSSYETCLHCEYCDIRIVLDSSTDTKFHAEKEHRSFCAFRRGGWRNCLEYVREFLSSGQVKMEEENEKVSGMKRLREEDERPMDSIPEASTDLAT
ncbi:hypothetical protein GpartN1_g4617.t1 [Galdieria partita]|uniref:C3HC-type domain-containing protein n=1 Tax=Galdieria partita TaxID=83374 RepID=A0A9C7PZN4_9RHOD|nr:hypothetical protein GpartN1_g4617.t1 [Galdieria partita]